MQWALSAIYTWQLVGRCVEQPVGQPITNRISTCDKMSRQLSSDFVFQRTATCGAISWATDCHCVYQRRYLLGNLWSNLSSDVSVNRLPNRLSTCGNMWSNLSGNWLPVGFQRSNFESNLSGNLSGNLLGNQLPNRVSTCGNLSGNLSGNALGNLSGNTLPDRLPNRLST